jgi:uncharacterized protein
VIFVDSSFWIAHAMPADSYHVDAARLTQKHERARLATSNLVLGETWSFLRRLEGRQRAFDWLDRTLAEVRVAVERVDEEIESQAWVWLRTHEERPFFFVKATSFALMHRLGITQAFAFGGLFATAGFDELRA